MYTNCSRVEEKRKEGYLMATTVPTQIRIEENTKRQAVEILEGLGLNLSDAVNIFLRQVILQSGIPFEIKYPEFKPEVKEDAKEPMQFSKDANMEEQEGWDSLADIF